MSDSQTIPYGYCQCGCGEKTRIAKKTRNPIGHRRGEPVQFVHGHNGRVPIATRLWERVDVRGPDDCWEWKAGLHKTGYGKLRSDAGVFAHRAAYWLSTGHLPGRDTVIMHVCDNPPCCNPRHLKAGTIAENMRDMVEKGRAAKGERHSQARLTEKQARAAIQRVANGETRKSVALDFGVSRTCIEALVAGKTWRHLPR